MGWELTDCRAHSAEVNGAESAWRPALSCAPHGSVLGPIMFSVFISTLDEGMESTFSKFGDGAELRGVSDTPGGRAAIQQDLHRLRVVQRGI